MYTGSLVQVYKRGDHYYAYVTEGGTRKRRVSLRTASVELADTRAARLEAKLLAGEHGVQAIDQGYTLAEWGRDYLAHLAAKQSPENTCLAVVRAFRRILGKLEALPLSRLEASHVEAVLPSLKVKGQTVNNYLALLRGAWKWAGTTGKVSLTKPCPFTATLPVQEKRTRRDLSPAEFLRLLEASSEEDRLRWGLMYYLGLRATVTGLFRGEWIQPDGGSVRIPPELQKRNKALTLPLPAPLRVLLAPHEGVKGPLLSVITRESAYRRLLADVRAAGIDPTGVSLHSLRHSFATRVYAATKDLHLVSQLLGHGAITTTQQYLHTDLEDMQQGVDKAFGPLE